ncbi:phage portal protein [Niameybacter massiliensis]|uniref:Phage portal protein n=1 Tax=Holtiella tumoricola TaxID=3018743 RepID=A0AA42J1D9_9FIRM|nr:phage portal protein [Holtiella tumoricola]MDA3732379.1 phage portal protein [Holtiella tumoricola]
MLKLIDKAIGIFSPQAALNRTLARKKLEILNSGYGNYGASHTRKASKGWRHGGGSHKEDIEDHLPTLRERSRDSYMGGAPIATSALKTTRTNVVGSGLKPRPNIDSEFIGLTEEQAMKWERDTMREFSLWAESTACDMERINNFYELQQLAFLSWIMNGDVFALLPYKPRPQMPYDLRIQLIEADRVCNPTFSTYESNIIQGVECDTDGEIVAYHIANYHPLSSMNPNGREIKRVRAYGEKTGRRNVIHCMESERVGQRRGVPLLAPVIETLKQLGRYTDAELMAAVVSGMYTVFIETQTIDQKPLGEDNEENTYEEEESEIALGSGAVVALAPGEKASFANPGRPNTAFEGFVNAMARQIGAALEIPPEILLKQFTNNYSASRGALLEAWKMFRMRRTWLANDFCQPIYEEWLTEAVAKGRIYAPGFFSDPLIRKVYCECDWCGPSPGQLDPVKEANAATIRVEQGFSTRQQETIEMNGGDFFDNNRQRIREEKARKELSMVTVIKEKGSE